MKAFFLVNNQGDWVCVEIASDISDATVKNSFTEVDGKGESIPRQFFIVDLPAVEDLRV